VIIEEVEDPNGEVAKPTTTFDILNESWFPIVDQTAMVDAILRDHVPSFWLAPEVRAEMARLDTLTGAAREDANRDLAAKFATDDVPVAAFGQPVFTGFFAPRLGCRIFPPYSFGVDLAALCLKSG